MSGGFRIGSAAAMLALAFGAPAAAQDVTRPAAVTGLALGRSGNDVELSWNPVLTDAAGQPEAIDHYRVYRGDDATFVPDKSGGSNLIGAPLGASDTDAGAAAGAQPYFYLVGAVDAAGNESDSKPPRVTTPPVLSGSWILSRIDVSWTTAEPSDEVQSYRVYWGKKSGQYLFVQDVGLATSYSLIGLEQWVNWFIAVTAVDSYGNESPSSNEHIDAVQGRVSVTALDAEHLCWISGGASCPPAPGRIQRNGGFQVLAPVEFPIGDWQRITVTYTLESRLCKPGAQGCTSKCGDTNPTGHGWNPCGDPWDRLAYLFLVLDDCVETGGNCITHDNLELMRAITPFGTDAPDPDGTGYVPPRVLTLDITPYASLLTGTKWVGADIAHFTDEGWWVTAVFKFFEGAPPGKPIADGIEVVAFGGAPTPTRQVTIPPQATDVRMRVFTSGHGGGYYCDGGSNNAGTCESNADCPGGVCNPCDEFCHRTNELLANGNPIWSVVPWRNDCSPSGNHCATWNACGVTSCTFPRAGWCPGYIACHHNEPCDNDIDLNGLLPPGGTYDIDYTVTPQNGSWPVSVVIYWYE